MISENRFTIQEFESKVKDFAQAVANKIPDASVVLRNDRAIRPFTGYIVTVRKNNSSQHTGLKLTRDGRVEMYNIFGDI